MDGVGVRGWAGAFVIYLYFKRFFMYQHGRSQGRQEEAFSPKPPKKFFNGFTCGAGVPVFLCIFAERPSGCVVEYY